MKLLTQEVAETLEADKSYHLGYNALNTNEFIYKHKSIDSMSSNDLTLNGSMKFLDINDGFIDSKNRLYKLDNDASYTAHNGEPLYILDKGETCEDIINNTTMLIL
mgnify:FL=1|tara:strand:+ start:292 stop:609 length:318 start_codon:yes stop_codon:yes gene_type:complete